jgi:hypothetical protein
LLDAVVHVENKSIKKKKKRLLHLQKHDIRKDKHICPGVTGTRNPSKRVTANPNLHNKAAGIGLRILISAGIP